MAATLRTKIHRFSFARTLVLEVLLLLTLSARAPWLLILLLGASALPVVAELRDRGRSVRVIVVHHGASLLLLAGGWTLVSLGDPDWKLAGYGLAAAGVAIRSGLLPAHCWVVDLFENAALGTALLATLPLLGVYAAARLLSPAAPEPVLVVLLVLAVFSALYNAAMSTVQSNARRFLCQVTLSNKALVFAGVVLPTSLGMTAGLVLWISVPLSVMGLGLTIRSLEARVGRLSLTRYNGLHEQTPTLTALYLVFGLASVGFPGTLGFFGAEMLTDAAARESTALGALVVLAATLGGIAVVRAYGRLFLGARHPSTVDLRIRRVELAVLLVLAALLVGGTLWPQPGIASRKVEADAVLDLRRAADQ
jgi:NADH-quinone oxidoreductase subunit M